MAKVIGDYIGTTFDDFEVITGLAEGWTPDDVSLESDFCGVKLGAPFFPAAMVSVVNKRFALAGAKAGIMPVAPRGLAPELEAEIVQYVKAHEVKPDGIEPQEFPVTLNANETLGDALKKTEEYGHSNIPVVAKYRQFVGMFTYKPSKHDKVKKSTPIKDVMEPFNADEVCYEGMSDEEIKAFLKKRGRRFVPVIEKACTDRGELPLLSRLVFMQRDEAYKVGAAIETQDGWENRAQMLVEAGADMIFIDTSDAYKGFSKDVVVKFKKMFPNGPLLCAGNIVTPEGFLYLAEAGADLVKDGMGPGSTCTTGHVVGVGAPPCWSTIEVAKARDEYARRKGGRYVPVIADGGIRGTGNMANALPWADGLMCGNAFGGFEESAGEKVRLPDGSLKVRIYGEASEEAYEKTGDMKRYTTPLNPESPTTFQGKSILIPYRGRFKPGFRAYTRTLKEALYHAGCKNLEEYRERAEMIRLSPAAMKDKRPHSGEVVD